MVRRILSTLILIAILSTSIFTVGVNTEDNLTTKLKENLIPIKTTQAGNGFEDLMPLKEILKDKKIIGMGEATHGTKEFFEMKHRMFEFLVEEMGYRIFAMESEFGGYQIVNDYILNGTGDIKNTLKALKFFAWSTQEVADMIEWMKKYNEDPKNKIKIKFYGFDMQDIGKNKDYILEYLDKIDIDKASEYRWHLMGLGNSSEPLDQDELNSLKIRVDMLKKEFNQEKELYISKSSIEEYELILQYINVINQWIYYNKEPTSNDRDRYMAENIEWILEYETKYYGNDKIMLWAHNLHITKSYYNQITMGEHLSNIYNNEYYSLGFDFYQGDFVAQPSSIFKGKKEHPLVAKFNIKTSPIESYSYEMEKTGVPISFLDFKKVEKDKDLMSFLSNEMYMNNVGFAYMGKWFKTHSLKFTINESYDGLIYVKTTTSSNKSVNYPIIDGEEYLANHYKSYIFTIVPFIILSIYICMLIFKHNNKKLRDRKLYPEYLNIFVNDLDDNKEMNGIRMKLIKLYEYSNSLSTITYICIISIILILINIGFNMILMKIKIPIDRNLNKEWIWGVALIGVLGTIFYVLILKFIVFVSKDKKIRFKQILTASILIGIIYLVLYLKNGVAISIINFIFILITSLIYNYSYTLYYYKGEKSLLILIAISIIESVLGSSIFYLL